MDITRKIKNSLPARVFAKAQPTAIRKMVSARSALHKLSSGNADSSEMLETVEGIRLGTLNPDLNLNAVSGSNEQSVSRLLDTLGIKWWALQTGAATSRVLNLMSEDFDRFLEGVARSEELREWYIEPLKPNGGRSQNARFASAAQSSSAAPGVRLYRFVAPHKGAKFQAGPQQGIDVVRWDEQLDQETITSAVWNPRLVELPSPLRAPEAWASALLLANQPSGHQVQFPIDAVVTWVDGQDSKWQRRKNHALGIEDTSTLVQDAADESRFDSFDELRYCLRSIEQHAPWIRRIFLVTDEQQPQWLKLNVESKVKVVDHREIWADQSQLPVFNSHAIEANLHRIPGLAEHFLYFNDDMLLASPVEADDFFHPSGVGKVFYSRALVDFAPVNELDNVSTVAAKNARNILVADGHPVMNRKFYHTPYPLCKSVLEELEEKYPAVFKETSGAKFRSLSDVALAGSFYFNYSLSTGKSVTGKIKYDYIDPADTESLKRLRSISFKRHVQTVVVNDGSQETSAARRLEIKRLLPQLLDELLPVKSSFEI